MALRRNKFDIGNEVVLTDGTTHRITFKLYDETNDTYLYLLDNKKWCKELDLSTFAASNMQTQKGICSECTK